jgi:chitinase
MAIGLWSNVVQSAATGVTKLTCRTRGARRKKLPLGTGTKQKSLMPHSVEWLPCAGELFQD